jgi:PAS domain S-box-containing protein
VGASVFHPLTFFLSTSMRHTPRSGYFNTLISPAFKIVAIYCITGCLWIFVTDQLINHWFQNSSDAITRLQTLKGWFFVGITTVMLYWLIHREMRRSQQTTEDLKNALAELQTTETALKQSEEQFRRFMDNSPAAYWITDSEGQPRYVSPITLRMFQLPPDCLGRSLLEIFPQEFAQIYLSRIQAVVESGQTLKAIEPGLGADGQQRQFLVYRFPLPQAGNSLEVGGVAIDITDRIRTEQELQRSEEQLRLAFDFAQIGSWDWDVRTNQMKWNKHHYLLLGLNPDTDTSNFENWRNRVHPEDLPGIEAAVDYALQTHITFEEEYRVIHPDGTVRWVIGKGKALYDDLGKPTRMIGAILDTTERRHIEEQLRLKEQQFRQAIVNAPYPIMLHAEDGEVVQINQVWTELTGYTISEIPTIAAWAEKAYGQKMETVRAAIDRLYQLNERIYEGEFTPFTKDGQQRIWDFSSAPIGRLPDGRRLVLSMAADITDRKRMEQTLRQQTERLQLINGIAQRIRQSLNLKEILNTTVVEVKNLLSADRVIVYQFAADRSGKIVAESVAPGWRVSLGAEIEDTCFKEGAGVDYLQGKKRAIANVDDAGLTDCHLQLLKQFEVKANLVVPILLMGGSKIIPEFLWGLLVVHQCESPREWPPDQLDLLEQIALQLAIAIQQAQTFEQSQTELVERQIIAENLREALAEKEVLLKEIHHRVKNNLQIVSGLLQLQAQNIDNPQMVNVLRECQNRVEAMALIHKTLYTSSDFGYIDATEYIERLAISLMGTYQIAPGKVALVVNVEPLVLSLDQAIPCGLIVNELMSNALKYAFPDGRHGKITLALTQMGDSVVLMIQDDGVGFPPGMDWDNTQSLGLSLVHALATDQLDGSLEVDHSQGTRFIIKFPPVLPKQ